MKGETNKILHVRRGEEGSDGMRSEECSAERRKWSGWDGMRGTGCDSNLERNITLKERHLHAASWLCWTLIRSLQGDTTGVSESLYSVHQYYSHNGEENTRMKNKITHKISTCN